VAIIGKAGTAPKNENAMVKATFLNTVVNYLTMIEPFK